MLVLELDPISRLIEFAETVLLSSKLTPFEILTWLYYSGWYIAVL